MPSTGTEHAATSANDRPEPALRPVHLSDLAMILRGAVGDFRRAPGVSMSIALVYTMGGWLLTALLTVFSLPFLVYPLAMGFALVAPFVAVAFYDVGRRLEQGETPTLTMAWCAVCDARNRDIRWMALITSFAFFIWMDIAAMITLSFFGATALDLPELLRQITTTSHGLAFLVVGHAVGAVIAFLVFAISAISIPMLFDRDIDIMTAMRASVRLVHANPVALGLWCAIIAASIVLAIATGLVLLPVVLPILGYASWRLYRHATAPVATETAPT